MKSIGIGIIAFLFLNLGAVRGGYDFSSTARIDYGDTTLLDGKTALSLSFSLKLDSTFSGTQGLVHKWGGTAGEQALLVIGNNTDEIHVVIHGTTAYQDKVTSNANLTTGVWYQVVITWTGTTMTVDVDGVSKTLTVNSNGSVDAIFNSSTALQVGYQTSESRTAVDGQIAEVAFWSAALDAGERTALGKGFRPWLIRPQSLVFYAPLVRELTELRSALAGSNTGASVAEHPAVR